MTEYALFKDGRQISKAHSTVHAARIEAYERGYVIVLAADFPGDQEMKGLLHLCDIKEVDQAS